MSEVERSQLALDRYEKGKKTRWQIGRDYEMCCAHHMRESGYIVDMNGIRMGREDMGRDLIAKSVRGDLFGGKTKIVQCKYWGKNRPITLFVARNKKTAKNGIKSLENIQASQPLVFA